MKKSSPSLCKILAVALAVIAGGVFCFLFFPWPLWIIVWSLFSIVGTVQILAPTRADTRPQTGKPVAGGDFSGFEDKIKWDKFSAFDQAEKKISWAKNLEEASDNKPDKGAPESSKPL